MNTGYLTTFEHNELDVLGVGTATALDAREASSLEALNERLQRPFCDRRYRSLKLSNFCGLVTTGLRLLEILPKIDDGRPPSQCRGILLNLLRHASDVSVFRHLSAAQQLRHAPLIEVFIASFFDSVSDIVRGGLMRQYQEHEDDLRVVRGRIAVGRQFTALANRQDKVACQFDELTADNAWNRFIKAGLRAVKPWLVSSELRRRWAELLIAFDEVDDLELQADEFSRLPLDRKAFRYLPAGEWARRVLALQSPAMRAGSEMSPGLLFDINALWEAAVAAELRRRLGETASQVDTQVTGRYLAAVEGSQRRAIGLRPDLVLSRAGRVIAVADTKWKRLELGRSGYLKPAPDDLYQMLAYAVTFECEHLALIYPWHSGLAQAHETILALPAIGTLHPRVSMLCINVDYGGLEPMRGRAWLEHLYKWSGDAASRAASQRTTESDTHRSMPGPSLPSVP